MPGLPGGGKRAKARQQAKKAHQARLGQPGQAGGPGAGRRQRSAPRRPCRGSAFGDPDGPNARPASTDDFELPKELRDLPLSPAPRPAVSAGYACETRQPPRAARTHESWFSTGAGRDAALATTSFAGMAEAAASTRGRAARRRAPGPVRRRRPGHVRAGRRRGRPRQRVDRPGPGRRALPHRSRRRRRGRRRPPEEQALADRDAGVLLLRDCGSPADTRWMDDRDDLPELIRAGRHLARPRRYIRNYAHEIEPDELVGLRRAGGQARRRLGQARRRLDRPRRRRPHTVLAAATRCRPRSPRPTSRAPG